MDKADSPQEKKEWETQLKGVLHEIAERKKTPEYKKARNELIVTVVTTSWMSAKQGLDVSMALGVGSAAVSLASGSLGGIIAIQTVAAAAKGLKEGVQEISKQSKEIKLLESGLKTAEQELATIDINEPSVAKQETKLKLESEIKEIKASLEDKKINQKVSCFKTIKSSFELTAGNVSLAVSVMTIAKVMGLSIAVGAVASTGVGALVLAGVAFGLAVAYLVVRHRNNQRKAQAAELAKNQPQITSDQANLGRIQEAIKKKSGALEAELGSKHQEQEVFASSASNKALKASLSQPPPLSQFSGLKD